MSKKILFSGLILVFYFNNCFNSNLENPADWTLFVYMESDKELNDAAIKNITDIARSGVKGNINVVVQLHAWQETAWRYVITGNSITLDSIVDLTLDPEQDLVNGLTWAFTNFPSKKIMTVLWNHGFGILDPVWSEHEDNWVPEISQDAQRTRSRLLTESLEHKNHRGVLFYPYTRVFLTNSGMVSAFNRVKNEVLFGRKIDIISADACKMAMLEIAYQLSGFADFLIGSQDCELKDGCDYFSLINQLSLGSSPKDVVKNVVRDYENYYKPRSACGRYTQSAIDLNFVKELTDNLDKLVNFLLSKNIKSLHEPAYPSIHPSTLSTTSGSWDERESDFQKKSIIEIIKNVRKIMPEFCSMPSYIDIYSFLVALKDEINFLKLEGINLNKNFEKILDILDNCLLSANKVVVANVSGFKSSHANGLSIYYPYEYSECSYVNCLFAKNSSWTNFLKSFAVS